jgi:hypothetical protein
MVITFVRDVELTPSQRFCRVSLDHPSLKSVTLPFDEVVCRDIRAGDTVVLSDGPRRGIDRVLLQKRPVWAREVRRKEASHV